METLNNRRSLGKSNYQLILVMSLILSFIICCFVSYIMKDYKLDDALIYYRYISNALEGKGLVYNEGERFNALTSPLYTYISLIMAYILGDIQISQIIICAIFLYLTGIMAVILFRGTISDFILGMTPVLISSSIYFYSTFGLETTLFLFLILLGIWLYKKEKYFLLGIVSSLLLLTRGESIFLVGTFIGMHFVQKRKIPSLKIFILPVLILFANFLFNFYYYNSFFPNTLLAKIYQGKSDLFGKWPIFFSSLDGFIQWFFDGDNLLIFFLIVFGCVGLILNYRNKIIATYIAFLIFYTLFYVILNIPNYHWYYAPYFLIIYILFSFGLDSIHKYGIGLDKNLKSKGILKYAYTALFSIGIFLILFYILIQQVSYAYKWRGAIGNKNYTNIGIWLRDNTDEKAKIACVEIGHIGWYSQRYIIDIFGLVNPNNARFIAEKRYGEWFRYYQPDYILVHNPLWIQEVGFKGLIEGGVYVPCDKFYFKGYTLLRKK